jgi:cyclopropane-fatty-acyl-phospholipid synthase
VTIDTTVSAVDARPDIEAIRHHYEVGNEFFRLILGDSMTYSAGFYEPGDDDHADLPRAQERKLDAFATLVGARPGARILDIGCGWGTALERAVDVHGAERAVGLTLSRTAADWIEGLGNPRVEVRVESWEDHQPDAPYDGILCINAIEHFVKGSLPPKEKLKRYRAMFRRWHSLLSEGGRVGLHMISLGKVPASRDVLRDMSAVLKDVFEGTHAPYLHELATATQGLFEFTDLRNDRLDCSRTMRVWLERLQGRRDEAVGLEGEATVASFERYLSVCVRMFGEGYFNDYRIGLTKIG